MGGRSLRTWFVALINLIPFPPLPRPLRPGPAFFRVLVVPFLLTSKAEPLHHPWLLLRVRWLHILTEDNLKTFKKYTQHHTTHTHTHQVQITKLF